MHIIVLLDKSDIDLQLNLRMSLFYSASLVSGAFGNLIAAGILDGLNSGQQGLSPWQWLYVIEGSITIAIGLIVVVVLPDFPHTWKSIPDDIRNVAVRRMGMSLNAVGHVKRLISAAALDASQSDIDAEGGMSQIQGLKLAFKDPKMYILAIGYHCTGSCVPQIETGTDHYFPRHCCCFGIPELLSDAYKRALR